MVRAPLWFKALATLLAVGVLAVWGSVLWLMLWAVQQGPDGLGALVGRFIRAAGGA